MSSKTLSISQSILAAIEEWVLVDPHTHINPLAPASRTLADLLGYHYYTELAHSAGLSRETIEEPGISAREKVLRIADGLAPLSNTVQLQWLEEIARDLFGFETLPKTREQWSIFYDASEQLMSAPAWNEVVMRKSGVKSVFLTNEFDDPLESFDTSVFIPCLRTDDLVFHFGKPKVRERLSTVTGIEATTVEKLRAAIGHRFERFVSKGARACAISLPPDFVPTAVDGSAAQKSLDAIWKSGENAGESDRRTLAQFAFQTLAEHCESHRLPFDLMIGVNRQVYPGGVYQGQDLYDSRVSLIQYRWLFNRFPKVHFPVSVLASVTNQELVSYAWIFPNVAPFGHWWYSNTPSIIEADLSHRLEAVPHTKLLGYYSDAYKMEFVLPKFRMYKRVLARCLASQYVEQRGWSETRAIELARTILQDNVTRYFGNFGR